MNLFCSSGNNLGISDLFAVDRQTNYLGNVAPFDRESQYFVDYLVPQIQIKLNLVCEPPINLETDQQNISVLSTNLFSEEIFYSKTVTYLNIIIMDQNDNSPIFTNPSDNGFLGFPDVKLAEKLMLRYLIQVEAYDLDEGINAKIKYSLTDNKDFIIDSETGVIYPRKSCMQDTELLNLGVVATDRDGASDGNSQFVVLNVWKLRDSHVAVLTVENQVLEQVEETIKQISTNLELELRPLNYFAVPSSEDVKSKQMIADTKIMINIYGFGESGVLLSAQEIIQTLSVAQLSSIASYSTFNDIMYKASDCNLTGLVVAVSVLGSLLLLMSISAPLVWFLWLRRYKESGASRDSNLSEKILEDNFNEETLGRSSPIAVVETSIENETTVSDAEILGIEIDGATQGKLSA